MNLWRSLWQNRTVPPVTEAALAELALANGCGQDVLLESLTAATEPTPPPDVHDNWSETAAGLAAAIRTPSESSLTDTTGGDPESESEAVQWSQKDESEAESATMPDDAVGHSSSGVAALFPVFRGENGHGNGADIGHKNEMTGNENMMSLRSQVPLVCVKTQVGITTGAVRTRTHDTRL